MKLDTFGVPILSVPYMTVEPAILHPICLPDPTYPSDTINGSFTDQTLLICIQMDRVRVNPSSSYDPFILARCFFYSDNLSTYDIECTFATFSKSRGQRSQTVGHVEWVGLGSIVGGW